MVEKLSIEELDSLESTAKICPFGEPNCFIPPYYCMLIC